MTNRRRIVLAGILVGLPLVFGYLHLTSLFVLFWVAILARIARRVLRYAPERRSGYRLWLWRVYGLVTFAVAVGLVVLGSGAFFSAHTPGALLGGAFAVFCGWFMGHVTWWLFFFPNRRPGREPGGGGASGGRGFQPSPSLVPAPRSPKTLIAAARLKFPPEPRNLI
jgi:hypothetical protein